MTHTTFRCPTCGSTEIRILAEVLTPYRPNDDNADFSAWKENLLFDEDSKAICSDEDCNDGHDDMWDGEVRDLILEVSCE